MTEDYIARAERNMREGNTPWHRLMENATDKLVKTVQTQHEIVKYAEAMAQVLAEAALASQKATGDHAMLALVRWIEVIRARAEELISENTQRKSDELRAKYGANLKRIQEGKTIDAKPEDVQEKDPGGG